MLTDDIVDRLARDLTPAPPPRWRNGVGLAALCLAELAGFLAAGMARPDLATAAATPVLWWKLAGLGVLALVGLVTATRAAAPERRPSIGLAVAVLLTLAALSTGGWLGAAATPGDLAARLAWRDGLHCLAFVSGLSIPPALLLARLLRRGAPTDPEGAALATGIGSAAWAAFVFVFACPHDDPLYVIAWYGLSMTLVVLASRVLLPRWLRW